MSVPVLMPSVHPGLDQSPVSIRADKEGECNMAQQQDNPNDQNRQQGGAGRAGQQQADQNRQQNSNNRQQGGQGDGAQQRADQDRDRQQGGTDRDQRGGQQR